MKFEVGKQYLYAGTQAKVTYIGPSADKEYAVFEDEYGSYDSDKWDKLEEIKEPRRFWVHMREDSFGNRSYPGIFDSQEEAFTVATNRGVYVFPVIEIMPDEDTSI